MGIGRRELITGSASLVLAISTAAVAKERRPDLADQMSGTWFGDVISDSQGPSRPGVTLTITRVAPNTVQITSDYGRLPVVVIPIERAMTAVVNRNGDSPFAFNKGRLDISFHNLVSWSGTKAGQ